MPTQQFRDRLFSNIHCSWIELLSEAMSRMDTRFLCDLESNDNWFPGVDRCFTAFSVPRGNIRVVWLGESPYPRRESANGLSFYDNRVQNLFRNNRELNSMGSSLRNILKAWFVAAERLNENCTNQSAIKRMNQDYLITNISELFTCGQNNGWLWLNAALSTWPEGTSPHLQICKWLPLIETVLRDASERGAQIVLLGDRVKEFSYMIDNPLTAPHPAARNGQFIRCQQVRDLLLYWRCLIESRQMDLCLSP